MINTPMKSRFLKGAVIALGLLILVGVIYNIRNPDLQLNQEEKQSVADPYGYVPFYGKSMEQYGFNDGQSYKIYYKRQCIAGNICAFKCLVDKCIGQPDGVVDYNKLLVSINDNCYWFEGNKNSWTEDGLEYESFDSRSYGCLKPEEFKMYGVVELERKNI
jgi:hypothetical protein